MESRNVLITKVQARASKILNSRCTLHPIITTSYTMPNGIVSHEAHQDLLQGHISRFIGLQLHFIEDVGSTISPTIILDYQPVAEFCVVITTK
jgi:hypothetical protein